MSSASARLLHVTPGRIRSEFYDDATQRQLGGIGIPCILSVLSSLVERVVARSHRIYSPTTLSRRRKQYRVFDAVEAPHITIERYLQRIFKYVNCSPSVLVVAYAYIDRLMQFHPEFRITWLNVHSLLIVAVTVASKFLQDLNYKNCFYARVGGLKTEDMNRLEIEFLFMMDFKLQVTVSVFESYCSHLEREVAFGGGFQIERTLRFVCGRDHENSREEDSLEQKLAVRHGYRRS